MPTPKAFPPEEDQFIHDVLTPLYWQKQTEHESSARALNACFDSLRHRFTSPEVDENILNAQKKVNGERKLRKQTEQILKPSRKHRCTGFEHYYHHVSKTDNPEYRELLDKVIREEEAKVAKDLGLILPDDPDTDSSGAPRKKLKSSRLVKSGRILQISRDLAKTLLLEQTEEVKQDMHRLYLKDCEIIQQEQKQDQNNLMACAVRSIIDDLRPCMDQLADILQPIRWSFTLLAGGLEPGLDGPRSFFYECGIQKFHDWHPDFKMQVDEPYHDFLAAIYTPQCHAKFEASLQMVYEGPEDLNNAANDEFNENMEDVDIPELNPHQQVVSNNLDQPCGQPAEGVTRARRGFRFLDEMGMRQYGSTSQNTFTELEGINYYSDAYAQFSFDRLDPDLSVYKIDDPIWDRVWTNKNWYSTNPPHTSQDAMHFDPPAPPVSTTFIRLYTANSGAPDLSGLYDDVAPLSTMTGSDQTLCSHVHAGGNMYGHAIP
ncbi:hypothetical protein EDD18DRAFT_1107718 [Armillaria luteobubalina]|uniref:Uncharacterized protein n=1 Tax=Armillaria luteobubalina TaxID=153913 RepID=A0AA39TL84_9AGAR|nr:hypothetical protein EDD18DRAFT_1107718 [Armillaria luteobubalina]